MAASAALRPWYTISSGPYSGMGTGVGVGATETDGAADAEATGVGTGVAIASADPLGTTTASWLPDGSAPAPASEASPAKMSASSTITMPASSRMTPISHGTACSAVEVAGSASSSASAWARRVLISPALGASDGSADRGSGTDGVQLEGRTWVDSDGSGQRGSELHGV